MPKITWFELYIPSERDLAAITAVLRPLATRPKLGWRRQTPIVVFELRAEAGNLHWLLGMDERLRHHLPAQLRAQLPGLVITPRPKPARALPLLVSNVRPIGMSQPLRTEMASAVTAGLLVILEALDHDESAVVQWVIGPAQQRRSRPTEFQPAAALGLVNQPQPTAADGRHWQQKATEPLFAVRCRVGASCRLPERASAITHMLIDALSLANASHTELRASKPAVRRAQHLADVQTHRRWAGILNAAELAAVLGWPLAGVNSLLAVPPAFHPAPPALLRPSNKSATSSARVLGISGHPVDADQRVIMPTTTALHHVQVTGPTGSGKSTLLAGFLGADIHAGRSVLLIEPRGDLVNDVLAGVPEGRRDDVVVIEPGQAEHVVGINPLAGPATEAEQRADDLLHLLHDIYGSNLGPRSSDVLLHGLIALARTPEGTLADMPALLTNASFRRQLLAAVNDPLILAPFFAWYDQLSDAERSQVIAPVLNKTRAFLSRTAIRRLLGQAKPRFQLDDLFKQCGRIVLVNLNKGAVGSETATLIGAILVNQLWQVIRRRAMQPARRRHPVMVVIDEVQDYLKLPIDLGEMFAQARALGISLTIAHQHLGQLPASLRTAILANARSRVVFRPAHADAQLLAAALGNGLTSADLERLDAFEACVQLLVDHRMSAPFSVKTLPPEKPISDPTALRQASQQRYGVDGTELDGHLQQRWRGEAMPDGPIGLTSRRAA